MVQKQTKALCARRVSSMRAKTFHKTSDVDQRLDLRPASPRRFSFEKHKTAHTFLSTQTSISFVPYSGAMMQQHFLGCMV
jgi:hypothetical protein